MNGPIVIAAGGTGGHFFPAEALAAALIARGHRVVLMTDKRTGRRMTGAFAECEQHILSGAGIAGRSLLRAAKGGLSLLAGTRQARTLLRTLRPVAVVGFGGYPCVPPLLAARLLGRARPLLVLHEQNAVLGRANRVLAKIADLLALGFDGTRGIPAGVNALVVGNPVRPGVLAAGPWQVPGARIALAVIGGSLGATVLSEVVPAAIALLDPALRARLHVTQQCRAADLDAVRAQYDAAGVDATLAPFFYDMAAVLRGAALVISRAGASTVAELTAIGRPAILVPLPGAIDDHQSANAQVLAAHGGSWTIAQPGFTAAALSAKLAALLADPQALADAAQASALQGRAGSADAFAELIETSLAERNVKKTPENTTSGGDANRRIGRHPAPESIHSASN